MFNFHIPQNRQSFEREKEAKHKLQSTNPVPNFIELLKQKIAQQFTA